MNLGMLLEKPKVSHKDLNSFFFCFLVLFSINSLPETFQVSKVQL